MKLLSSPLLYLALSLWLRPAHAADHFAQIPEEQTLVLSPSTLFPGTSSTHLKKVSVPPQHGQIAVSADALQYSPSPGFVGLDHLSVEIAGGPLGSRDPHEVKITIRVVPRALPATIQNTFNNAQSPGFYDSVDHAFDFCDPWATSRSQLYCTRFDVPQAEAGWIPATGRWPEGDHSPPPLFDAETGNLYLLARSDGSEFRIRDSFQFPETIGSWPTFGDWKGNGESHPAFVALDGTVRVFDLSTRTMIAAQQELLETGPGKAKPWPAVWPVDGRDTLAWIDTSHHKLHWRDVMPSPISESSGGEVLDLVQTGRRLPITSDVLEWAGYGDALLFFEPTDMAGAEYLLVWFQDQGGNWPSPSTLPLKFPHEPPGS